MMILNVCIVFYYLYIIFICFVIISFEEIKIILEFVLYLLKIVLFRIIEWMDLFFLMFWFVIVFLILVNVFYLVSIGMVKLFNKKDYSWFVYLLVLFVFFLFIWVISMDKMI